MPELKRDQPEAREAVRLSAASSQIANDTRVAAAKAAEAAVEIENAAANATSDMVHRAADQGREYARQGMRAMAAVQAPLADVSYEGSRRMVEATAGVTDIYRDTAERSAGDVQALVGAYTSIGRGCQQYQHTCLDLLSRSMQSMASKQQNLSRANSPVAFAEIQRDICFEAVNAMFTGSTTLLQLVGQIAQDAVKPLQERARAHAQH